MKRMIGCGVLLVTFGLGWTAPALAFPPQHAAAGKVTPGYLGIDVRDISDDEAPALKLRDSRGAEIIRVDHDGPAGKMGLREHDVIIQMNGMIIDGEEQIRRLLHEIAPGKIVAMIVSREGRQLKLTTQMATRTEVERQAWEKHLVAPQAPATGLPSEDPANQGVQSVAAGAAPKTPYSKGFLGTILLTPAYTGVMLERIGPQLSQFFGVPRGTGLLVQGVEANSPAAMAGVRAGDVVVRADTKAVASLSDWVKIIRDAKGKPVTVVVLRDHKETVLTVTPEAKKRS